MKTLGPRRAAGSRCVIAIPCNRHIETLYRSCTRASRRCAAQTACAAGESPPHLPFHEWYSMSEINAVCVYCGSNPGTDAAFIGSARDFGKILGQNGIRLIYGGGSIGLMGALATSVI